MQKKLMNSITRLNSKGNNFDFKIKKSHFSVWFFSYIDYFKNHLLSLVKNQVLQMLHDKLLILHLQTVILDYFFLSHRNLQAIVPR